MQSVEFDTEPPTKDIKIESASEPEKAARKVHGVKVSISCPLIFGAEEKLTLVIQWFIFVTAVLSTTFLFGLDNTLVRPIFSSVTNSCARARGEKKRRRKRNSSLYLPTLPGCRYTTKHHSATWRNLQTTMGGNLVCLGRGCYHTSLVSIY